MGFVIGSEGGYGSEEGEGTLLVEPVQKHVSEDLADAAYAEDRVAVRGGGDALLARGAEAVGSQHLLAVDQHADAARGA